VCRRYVAPSKTLLRFLLVIRLIGMLYGILHPLHTSPIVSAFKLNFIRGGLILTAHLHHCVADNAGFGGFVYQLAENCYSVFHKTRPPLWDIRCLDRSQFRCKEISSLRKMNMAPQSDQKTSQPVHQPITALLLHLPRSKAEALKHLATPQAATFAFLHMTHSPPSYGDLS
jgi:hypothetical protein